MEARGKEKEKGGMKKKQKKRKYIKGAKKEKEKAREKKVQIKIKTKKGTFLSTFHTDSPSPPFIVSLKPLINYLNMHSYAN